MQQQALILLFLILFAVGLPSIGAGWLGKHLIDTLGRYPSKTPAIQMSILVKLVVLEMVSFTLLLAILKVLSVPIEEVEKPKVVHLQRSVVIWNSAC
ncbi:MAG TPA: hypothetical protein P5160_09220 [Candidatus Omnitrophota bacterium]|nr:hypothetical protein [Candidatus Omnitrophota bacterium]